MKPISLRRILSRATALFLVVALALPPSAHALRVENAGMEESSQRRELDRHLRSVSPSTTGLEERYPLWEFFASPSAASYASTHEQLAQAAGDYHDFFGKESEYNRIDTRIVDRDEKLQALHRLEDAWENRLSLVPMTAIFNFYRQLGSFEDMVRFYERFAQRDELFGRSIAAFNDYVLARNRLGSLDAAILDRIHQQIRELEEKARTQSTGGRDPDEDKATQVLLGESYIGLGTNQKNRYAAVMDRQLGLAAGPMPDAAELHQADEALGRAQEFYAQAFEADLSYYSGNNVLRTLIYRRRMEEARQLSRLVQRTVFQSDYRHFFWEMATLLEIGLLNQDSQEVTQRLQSVLQVPRAQSEADSLLEHLRRWSRLEQQRAGSSSLTGTLDAVIDILQTVREPLGASALDSDSIRTRLSETTWPLWDRLAGNLSNPVGLQRSIEQQVEDITIQIGRYRRATVLDNNFHLGGLIPPVVLNLTDRSVLRGILSRLGLMEDVQPRAVLQRIYAYLENRFRLKNPVTGQRDLEVLNSPRHVSQIDELFKKLFSFTSAREAGIAGTNLSSALEFGAADCRFLGFAEQGLLEERAAFRNDRENRAAYQAWEAGDGEAYDRALEKARRLMVQDFEFGGTVHKNLSREIALFQVVIEGPLQLEENILKRNSAGIPLYDPQGTRKLEDHTLVAAILRDSGGKIQFIVLIDPWYHETYRLGYHVITREQLENHLGPDGTIEEKGLPVAGGARAYDEVTGQIREVDLALKPVRYAQRVMDADNRRLKEPRRYLPEGQTFFAHPVKPVSAEALVSNPDSSPPENPLVRLLQEKEPSRRSVRLVDDLSVQVSKDQFGPDDSTRLFVDLFRQHPDWFEGDLLELGTGAGGLAIFLARQGRNVVGLDVQPKAIVDAEFNKSELPESVRSHLVFGVSDLYENLTGVTRDARRRFDAALFVNPIFTGGGFFTSRGEAFQTAVYAGPDGDVVRRAVEGLPLALKPGKSGFFFAATQNDTNISALSSDALRAMLPNDRWRMDPTGVTVTVSERFRQAGEMLDGHITYEVFRITPPQSAAAGLEELQRESLQADTRRIVAEARRIFSVGEYGYAGLIRRPEMRVDPRVVGHSGPYRGKTRLHLVVPRSLDETGRLPYAWDCSEAVDFIVHKALQQGHQAAKVWVKTPLWKGGDVAAQIDGELYSITPGVDLQTATSAQFVETTQESIQASTAMKAKAISVEAGMIPIAFEEEEGLPVLLTGAAAFFATGGPVLKILLAAVPIRGGSFKERYSFSVDLPVAELSKIQQAVRAGTSVLEPHWDTVPQDVRIQRVVARHRDLFDRLLLGLTPEAIQYLETRASWTEPAARAALLDTLKSLQAEAEQVFPAQGYGLGSVLADPESRIVEMDSRLTLVSDAREEGRNWDSMRKALWMGRKLRERGYEPSILLVSDSTGLPDAMLEVNDMELPMLLDRYDNPYETELDQVLSVDQLADLLGEEPAGQIVLEREEAMPLLYGRVGRIHVLMGMAIRREGDELQIHFPLVGLDSGRTLAFDQQLDLALSISQVRAFQRQLQTVAGQARLLDILLEQRPDSVSPRTWEPIVQRVFHAVERVIFKLDPAWVERQSSGTGLEEKLAVAANELYKFQDLFHQFFGVGDRGDYAQWGWEGFLDAVRQRDQDSYEVFRSLPVPEGRWLQGNLLRFKPTGKGFLVTTSRPGYGKGMVSATLVGSREKGWIEPNPESPWEFLVDDTVLVLNFSGRLLAGFPPSAEIEAKALLTKYPLSRGLPSPAGTGEFLTRIPEKKLFVPLQGIIWINREEEFRGSENLSDRLGSVNQYDSMPLWSSGFRERIHNLEYREEFVGSLSDLDRLYAQLAQVTQWASGLAAGLEEQGINQTMVMLDEVAPQGEGILVLETGVLGRAGLEELVGRMGPHLGRRVVLFGKESAAAKEAAARSGILLVDSDDPADLAFRLAGLEERAGRIGYVGNRRTADWLAKLLPSSMEVTPLDPAATLPDLFRFLGYPASFLGQINASGLEEGLARSRAA